MLSAPPFPRPPDDFPSCRAGVRAFILRYQPVQLGHDVLQAAVDVAPQRGDLDPVQLSVEVGVDFVHRAGPVHLLGERTGGGVVGQRGSLMADGVRRDAAGGRNQQHRIGSGITGYDLSLVDC